MKPVLKLGDTEFVVEPVQFGNRIRIEIDGHKIDVEHSRSDAHDGVIVVNGVEYPYAVAQDDKKMFLHLAGRSWEVDVVDEFSKVGTDVGPGSGAVTAPMPGVVLEINVAEGDEVTADQPLALIESMKMQTELRAPIAGTVSAVNVTVGESFEKSTVLVDVHPRED